VEDEVAALDLAAQVRLLTGADMWHLPAEPAVGLRAIAMSDGPAGVRGAAWDERDPSALIPNAASLAATWDADLVASVGALVGADAVRKGVDVLLAPTIGLHRSPLGGRNFESWSEDPLLTGRLAAAFVRGVQSRGVAATAKHYVANDTEQERFTYDARVPADVLRERALRPFADLVAAGVWVVMAAYNAVDGTSMTDHRTLTRDLLKTAWGFDGVVVSDWFATRSTEASAASGLDVVMPGPHGPWGDALVAAVEAGRVDPDDVADKVRRVLRLARRVGAVEGAPPAVARVPGPPPDDPTVRAALRTAAARGMVLLRDDGVLPLGPGTVAVVGEPATSVSAQGGGSAHVEPPHVVQPLDALRDRLGAAVRHASGPAVSPTLRALDVALVTDPVDGTPGVRLAILDGDGAVLRDEHRTATALTFLGDLPEGARTVRLTAVLDAPTGPHELAVTGNAALTLSLDGETVLDHDGSAALTDPAEALSRPPEGRVAVDLDGPVRLVAELALPERAPFAVIGIGHRRGRATDDERIAEAVAAAAAADVAVVLVGTTDVVESEGFDRADLRLPGRQDELVAAVAAANPRTVVVVNAGAVVELPWADDVAAILWAGLPGQEAGAAIADVLLGATEPWGRLTATLPVALADAAVPSTAPVAGVVAHDEGLAVGYAAGGPAPRFPFGHGLGFTTWALERAVLDPGAGIVLVDVRNTGDRQGRDVVQVYLAPVGAPVRLVGFAAVEADAGAVVTAEVAIDPVAASRWDVEGGRWAPHADGELRVGRSAADIAWRLPVEQPLVAAPADAPGLPRG
jgi:beta-glucosidase